MTRAALVLSLAAIVPAFVTAQPPRPAQPATAAARIKIDVDRAIGQVDPLLFGNFAEHLGRMIYGGLYDEAAPLRAALAFERATKWHTMHPKVDWGTKAV